MRNVCSDWHGCPPCFLRSQCTYLLALGTGCYYYTLLCPSLGILLSFTALLNPTVVSSPTRPHLVSGSWWSDRSLWSLAALWGISEGPTVEFPTGSIALAQSSVAVIISLCPNFWLYFLWGMSHDSSSQKFLISESISRELNLRAIGARSGPRKRIVNGIWG